MVRAIQQSQHDQVSQYYLSYLGDAVVIIEGAISRLRDSDASLCDISDAINMAHRIKGNAAMYDYPELGVQAGQVEAQLRASAHLKDRPKALISLMKFVDSIHIICNDIEYLEAEKPGFTFIGNADEADDTPENVTHFPNSKSVLIACQDPWVSDLLSSMIDPHYNVIKCHSEGDIRRAMRSQLPDLMVLEHDFSGTNSLELLKEFKTSLSLSKMSVFIAFNPNSPEAIAEAISLGVDGFTEDKHEILEIAEYVRGFFDTPMQSVLVVDDDPVVRDILEHMLKANGYKVDTATDGLEALEYLSSQTPDIVLLDRFMPRLEGGTVLYEIQNKINLKSIPVLILTSMVNRGEAKSWFERGAADFIPKPFDPEEVLMRVKQHLEIGQKVA